VLLHILAGLRPHLQIDLQACHIHHGLSTQAEIWRAHCHAACAALAVPCETRYVQVDRGSKAGLEAAAREARYQALTSISTDWLVLAHHADDQAETLLFRLCRGTGVKGMAGMRGIDPARRLLRPLLYASRCDLEAYAHAHQLAWVEDDSNPDTGFSRNYLREIVLKPLRARFPAAVASLAGSASRFAESDQLLDDLARLDAQAIRFGECGSRTRWQSLSWSRARNLLRHCLASGGAVYLPEARRLEDGLRQIATSTAARWVFGKQAVCVYRDQIWFEPAVLATPTPVVWRGQPVLSWGEGEIHFPATWASEAPCEVVVYGTTSCGVPGDGWSSRHFKHLCQEAGVPPWWRSVLPGIKRGDVLLWVGGVWADQSARQPSWQGGWRGFQSQSGKRFRLPDEHQLTDGEPRNKAN
jgi:tRNA(Ile)-lysidine synthase